MRSSIGVVAVSTRPVVRVTSRAHNPSRYSVVGLVLDRLGYPHDRETIPRAVRY
jgi:hypothetical protein